jgi:glucose-6-phosphate 1-dehydrogenase
MAKSTADVFVVFGISGDLAREMTFRSLYRLERRRLLDCPIVGVAVDDWTIARLRRQMRDSIKASGEKLDRNVFDRLAARVSCLGSALDDGRRPHRLTHASSVLGARLR